MLGFSKEKILVTCTEGTTGRVREVEREEARDGDEERVIAVEEVIPLVTNAEMQWLLPVLILDLVQTFNALRATHILTSLS